MQGQKSAWRRPRIKGRPQLYRTSRPVLAQLLQRCQIIFDPSLQTLTIRERRTGSKKSVPLSTAQLARLKQLYKDPDQPGWIEWAGEVLFKTLDWPGGV